MSAKLLYPLRCLLCSHIDRERVEFAAPKLLQMTLFSNADLHVQSLQVSIMCTPLVTYETPPTYFRTGKITSAFQVWLQDTCHSVACAWRFSLRSNRLILLLSSA